MPEKKNRVPTKWMHFSILSETSSTTSPTRDEDTCGNAEAKYSFYLCKYCELSSGAIAAEAHPLVSAIAPVPLFLIPINVFDNNNNDNTDN